MFGHTFANAMKSIKVSTITLLTDEYGKTIYEYVSPNDKYYVYPNVMFCTCPAFKRQVLVQDQSRVCKHVIATRIASALGDGSVKQGFLEFSEMTKVYCDMSHCTTRHPVHPDTAAATGATASASSGHNETNDTDLSAEMTPGETSTESLGPDN